MNFEFLSISIKGGCGFGKSEVYKIKKIESGVVSQSRYVGLEQIKLVM